MNNFNKRVFYLVCLSGSMLFGGCTAGYKNVQRDFITYNEATLTEGIKPDVNFDGKPIKVAVTEFSLPNESGGPDYQAARLANLTQYSADIVNDDISKAGGALVSRDESMRIAKYIQAAEKRGTGDNSNCSNSRKKHHKKSKHCDSSQAGPYKGFGDVSYAILGEISSVSYGSGTSTSLIQVKGQSGTVCSYSASVSGTLAVYKIPNTVRHASIHFKGEDTATADGSCSTGILSPQLVKLAMEKAISSVRGEIMNLLSMDAYVIAKRAHPEKKSEIFQISAGKNINLRPGAKVRFMHVDQKLDPVTGNMENLETMVGEGVISDKVDATRAWIFVDQEKDKGIRMWDIARPFYENCKYFFLCDGPE